MLRYFDYFDPSNGKWDPMSVGVPPSAMTPDYLQKKDMQKPPPLALSYKHYTAKEWFVALAKMKAKDTLVWNVNTWLCFLASWMYESFEGQLDSDITCFGHVIVRAGKIRPTDLLEITSGTAVHPNIANMTDSPSVADINRLALSMMGLYRLCKATTQADYKQQILERIGNLSTSPLFVNGTFSMTSILDQSADAVGIVNDPRFKRLVAALDMFLDIFSTGDEEIYRVATIVLRYEDCAMLGLLSTVSKVISKSLTCTISLCFDAGAAGEMREMYRYEASEMTKTQSYLPYCRSMGLVLRSPYSVPMNISFYTYYTTLLACLDNVRGLNAIHLSSAPVTKMLNITCRIAYLIKGSDDYQLRFVGKSKEKALTPASAHGSNTDDDDNNGGETDLGSTVSMEQKDTNWANKILQNLKTIETIDLERFLNAFRNKQCRPGTIGEALQNFHPSPIGDS